MLINERHIQRTLRTVLCLIAASLIAAGCHYDKKASYAATAEYSRKQLDSLEFADKHHYSVNYNFIVKADSINLVRQQPEEVMGRMMTDTVTVYRHDHLAVAEIRILPTDSIDSVWVQVARDQDTFGWLHESAAVRRARRPHIAVHLDVLRHPLADIPHRDKPHIGGLPDAHHLPTERQDSAL